MLITIQSFLFQIAEIIPGVSLISIVIRPHLLRYRETVLFVTVNMESPALDWRDSVRLDFLHYQRIITLRQFPGIKYIK